MNFTLRLVYLSPTYYSPISQALLLKMSVNTHGSQGTVAHTAVRAQWHTRQSGHSGTHGSPAGPAQWDTRQSGGTHGSQGTVGHTAVGAQWDTRHSGHSGTRQQATTTNSQTIR